MIEILNWLSLIKFVLANIVMPLGDVGTDFNTFLSLSHFPFLSHFCENLSCLPFFYSETQTPPPNTVCDTNLTAMTTTTTMTTMTAMTIEDDRHAWWATLTLGWMFVPALIRLATYIYFSVMNMFNCGSPVTSEKKCSCCCCPVFFNTVLIHLPFCLPIYNVHLAFQLRYLRYGMNSFDARDSARVEEILSEVAASSFLESYFEAGGQATLQLIIIFSTGQASFSQQISIVMSLLTLALGASRGYFNQRYEDAADPDPALSMVVMHVFPLMFVIVFNSLTQWVLIGGLLGPWTFPALFVNSGLIFACLKIIPVLPSNMRSLLRSVGEWAEWAIRMMRSVGEWAIRMIRNLEELIDANPDVTLVFALPPFWPMGIILGCRYLLREQRGGAGDIEMEEARSFVDVEKGETKSTGTGEIEMEEARSSVDVEKGEAKSTKALEVPRERKNMFFVLKASTFSVWVPSVVGNIKVFPNMFIISSV